MFNYIISKIWLKISEPLPEKKSISNLRAYTFATLIVFTQFIDSITTIIGLKNKGAQEANGIMDHFIHSVGYTPFVIFKIFAGLLLAISTFRKRSSPVIIVFIYTLVIINNLYVLGRL